MLGRAWCPNEKRLIKVRRGLDSAYQSTNHHFLKISSALNLLRLMFYSSFILVGVFKCDSTSCNRGNFYSVKISASPHTPKGTFHFRPPSKLIGKLWLVLKMFSIPNNLDSFNIIFDTSCASTPCVQIQARNLAEHFHFIIILTRQNLISVFDVVKSLSYVIRLSPYLKCFYSNVLAKSEY